MSERVLHARKGQTGTAGLDGTVPPGGFFTSAAASLELALIVSAVRKLQKRANIGPGRAAIRLEESPVFFVRVIGKPYKTAQAPIAPEHFPCGPSLGRNPRRTAGT